MTTRWSINKSIRIVFVLVFCIIHLTACFTSRSTLGVQNAVSWKKKCNKSNKTSIPLFVTANKKRMNDEEEAEGIVSSSTSFVTENSSKSGKKQKQRRNYIDDNEYYDDGEEEEYEEDYSFEYDYEYDYEYEYDDEKSSEWENYNGVDIYLPPSSTPPRAILHFIGGTFLGSLPPRVLYSTLLEGVIAKCNVPIAIIATPIPILYPKTFDFMAPLDHLKKAKAIRETLDDVYKNVLLDEYSQEELQYVPIVGVGHSLGARLHILMDVIGETMAMTTTKRRRRKEKIAKKEVKSNILISFNWHAKESIPLLNQFSKFVHSDSSVNKGRRKRSTDDNTIILSRLEFQPSPDALWEILQTPTNTITKEDDTPKQKPNNDYTIPHNLIIQFDEDTLDQSSELAHCLSQSGKTTNIRFARLNGSHLTPCTWTLDDVRDLFLQQQEDAEEEDMVLKDMVVNREQQIQDLIDSVSTYVDFIVR